VQDAAAAFINWLFSDPKRDAQITAAITQDWLMPVPIPALDFPKTWDPRIRSLYAAIQEAYGSRRIGYTTWTFFPPKTEQKIIDDVYRVFGGDITPARMMADVQSTFAPEFKVGSMVQIPKPAGA
jgi:raffinose/stachyose/melibiose transport system substrate-binding protein